jgi:hypothetical protein
MRITIDQWLQLHDAQQNATKALHDMESVLADLVLAHAHNAVEKRILLKILSHLDDARSELGLIDCCPQNEWTGGDSSKMENTSVREPRCVPEPREYLLKRMSLEAYRINAAAAHPTKSGS